MVHIDGLEFPRSLTKLQQLQDFMMFKYKEKFDSVTACNWWIRRNILAFRYEFEENDESCPLYDDITSKLDGAKRSEKTAMRELFEKEKTRKAAEFKPGQSVSLPLPTSETDNKSPTPPGYS